MTTIDTDICVIGAGSGGLSVAAGAVQMGARVVLVEGGKMGGDCLNYGCVPSKALIAAADIAHTVRTGGMGTKGTEPDTSYMAAMDHVRSVIATIAPHDSQERFEGLGCTVLRGYARFISPTEVDINGRIVRARRFVIATGSRPMVPPITGLDQVPYLTNESLWSLREKPGHLLVLGGGPIGMEMAQAHRRLGCDVTVIEGAKALGRDDPEAAGIVLDALRKDGVDIREGVTVEGVSGQAGAVTLRLSDGTTVAGTHLLVAAGRVPNIERLDLPTAEVDRNKSGIIVDDTLRTSNRKIYAIGDVAGGMQFTHVAGYQAGVIVRSMLFGWPAKASTRHIPYATYTDPELAQVGLVEADARTMYGDKVEVLCSELSGNDRAIAGAKTSGFVKVMVVKGRPVGATIVGAHAGELISFWALAIAGNMKMSRISGMVAPYPTLMEVNKRAVGAYFSPRLFESRMVKVIVKGVQRILP